MNSSSSRFSDSQSEGTRSSSGGGFDDDDDDDDGGGHSSNVMSIFASYYGIDNDADGGPNGTTKGIEDHKRPASDFINAAKFKPNAYVKELLLTSDFETLMSKDLKMVQEIKTLDSDMQMLVYENYNKFISATETIKHMKLNIEKMYVETKHFSGRMLDIERVATKIDTSMRPQLESVSKLVRIRRLLSRLEFLSELPEKLERLISDERYEVAVKLYKESIGTLQKSRNLNFLSFQNIREKTIKMMDDLRLRVVGLLDDTSSSSNKLSTYAQVLRMMEAPRDMVLDRFLNTHKKRFSDLLKPFEVTSTSSNSSSSSSSSLVQKAVNLSDIRQFHQKFTVDIIEVNKGAFELFSNENKYDDIHATLDEIAFASSASTASTKSNASTSTSGGDISTSETGPSRPPSRKVPIVRSSDICLDIPLAVILNLFSHFQAIIKLKGLLNDVISRYTAILTRQFSAFFDQTFTSASPKLPDINDDGLCSSIVQLRQCFMDMQYVDNSSLAQSQLITNYALNCWIIKSKISDVSNADLVESIIIYCYNNASSLNSITIAPGAEFTSDFEHSSATFTTAFVRRILPVLQNSFTNRLLSSYIDTCSENILQAYSLQVLPHLSFEDTKDFKDGKAMGLGLSSNPFSGGNLIRGAIAKKMGSTRDEIQGIASTALTQLLGNLTKLFKLLIDVYNTIINSNNKLIRQSKNYSSAMDSSNSGSSFINNNNGGSGGGSRSSKFSSSNPPSSAVKGGNSSSSRGRSASMAIADLCGSRVFGNFIGTDLPAAVGQDYLNNIHYNNNSNNGSNSNNSGHGNHITFPEDVLNFSTAGDMLHCYAFASMHRLCTQIENASSVVIPLYRYDSSYGPLYRLDCSGEVSLIARSIADKNTSGHSVVINGSSSGSKSSSGECKSSEDKEASTSSPSTTTNSNFRLDTRVVYLSVLTHQLKALFAPTLDEAIETAKLFDDADDEDDDKSNRRSTGSNFATLRAKSEARLEISGHHMFLTYLQSTCANIEFSMKHLLLDIYRAHRHTSESSPQIAPSCLVTSFALFAESIYLSLTLLLSALPTTTSTTTSSNGSNSNSSSSGAGVLIPSLASSVAAADNRPTNPKKNGSEAGQNFLSSKVRAFDFRLCSFQPNRSALIGNKRYLFYSVDVVVGSLFKAAIASLTEHIKLLTISKSVYTHLNGVVQFIHGLSNVFLKPEGSIPENTVPGCYSYGGMCEVGIATLVDSLNMSLLSRYADANDFGAVLSNNSGSANTVNSAQVLSMYISATHNDSIVI